MDAKRAFSRKGVAVIAFWITVILVVVADQATKAAINHLLPVGESAPFVPGLLELRHIENTGAAFSIGRGASWLFVGCALAVFAAACVFVWRNDVPPSLALSIGSVAGGGIGNMVDRLANGSVTDFLATTFVTFPVFNVADIFVTCGVAASVVLYLRWEEARGEGEVADMGQRHA